MNGLGDNSSCRVAGPVEVPTLTNFIGGKQVACGSGRYLENFNPSTGELLCTIPDSDSHDISHAVESAQRVAAAWGKTPFAERAQLMQNLATLIDANLEQLALLESNDNGKPLTLARAVDIPRSAANFRFFAKHSEAFFSQQHRDSESNIVTDVVHDPLGVVGCISPWNLPLYLFTWKIAPAIAAGNTVVAKPSEVTPMTAHRLGELFSEAGFPPGVLNIVHGRGQQAGEALVRHPAVAAISFTGSAKVGQRILAITQELGKKVTLELGGKNPAIILADVEDDPALYQQMIKTTVRSSFANQGQICLCTSRIFVQRALFERFKGDFISEVKRLKVGDPLEPDTDQGALVSKEHYDKVLSYLELARTEGGKLLCGGAPAKLPGRVKKGLFIEPTVISDLHHTARVNQEEIFGPVVTLIPFDSIVEAIDQANSTEYGLAATVWSSDLTAASEIAREVESGIIWINDWMKRDLCTPFGGFKSSGYGREGGDYALRFFTRQPKSITLP